MPADWPAPAQVRAGITNRVGGSSRHPCQGFNLALHVGDDSSAVAANRAELRRGLKLAHEPCWMQQVHGNRVVAAAEGVTQPADGCHASDPGQVCAVLIADCVPLLLTDPAGSQVAAVHAGWRGIAAGIIGAALAALNARPEQVLAWIGPCIGPARYTVGADVRSACLQLDPETTGCFESRTGDRWSADLKQLCRHQLQRHGVRAIHASDLCVHDHPELFYSHRRDGQTGRMAALIWIDARQS
jgi:hypothetical protein